MCGTLLVLGLGAPRRLAGAERGSRFLQIPLDQSEERVRASKHTARGPLRVLERRHGLADIVERGAVVLTHLEGNVVRFAPLYEKYNGGKAMSSHWMKRRNATIFEPPHRRRKGRVSQNYRDELQRRRAKKARRRANH